MFVNEFIKKNHAIISKYLKEKYSLDIDVKIDKATIPQWDFYSSIAMQLSKKLKRAPIDITMELSKLSFYGTGAVEAVKPGFLNFRVSKELLLKNLNGFSFSTDKKINKRVNIEFISANPTGPMNVVSGRAATFGLALSRLFQYDGWDVDKEYYINNAGNQVNIFANSIYKAYREKVKGEKVEFSEDEYKGEYIYDIAEHFKDKIAELGDEEEIINFLKKKAVTLIIDDNKKMLSGFGLDFDIWFSESSLYEKGYDKDVLLHLKEKDLLYEKDGALFVKNTELGDTQDWVLRKGTGEYTYFFGDIMYHLDKFRRGYDKAINIWGPDHQGSAKRLKILLENAFDIPRDFLEIIILQQVNLLKDGEKLKVSKRLGNFITLEEILEKVGTDVSRFYFLSRGYKQHVDFSLDTIEKENENSAVFYIQYMFARINGVLIKGNFDNKVEKLNKLGENERNMAFKLFIFPLLMSEALRKREPSMVIHTLNELAGDFHHFYHDNKIIGSNDEEHLINFIKIIGNFIKNSLNLLGFNAPERM
ncbi:arginine--tRNA ligase [bacterium]|nr:arginine--tRNA ligase [bacterium]